MNAEKGKISHKNLPETAKIKKKSNGTKVHKLTTPK